MPRLFCFGLGYTAARLARRLAARGWSIAGTTRDVDRRQRELGEPTWSLYAFDGGCPIAELDRALAGTTHVLHSIMPDGGGDPVLRWHADALPRVWTGYLSTTGVYGDHAGAWVDEDTPRRPTSPRTERRREAEDHWLSRGALVFRLAGIYGPGRSALERVEAGRAKQIVKPGKVFNRIHVDDIVATLEAAIAQPSGPGRAFNVADGNPAGSDAVIRYAAELLGIEPPPPVAFEDAEMSAMARSFWANDARITNRRIRDELGVELRYPDYRAGLRQCLEARRASEPA